MEEEEGTHLELVERLEHLLLNRVRKRSTALDFLLAVLEDLSPGTTDGRKGVALVVLAVVSRTREGLEQESQLVGPDPEMLSRERTLKRPFLSRVHGFFG